MDTCINVNAFKKLARIGKGAYGTVYRARERDSEKIYALKRVLHEVHEDGFPITSLREISLLRRCAHEYVVRLHCVAVSSSDTFLVLEYCDHDFAQILRMRSESGKSSSSARFGLGAGDLKRLCMQLLEAVAHLHSCFVLHRDIKPSNLLYSRHGGLKLADFGLARGFGSGAIDVQTRPRSQARDEASVTRVPAAADTSEIKQLYTPGVTTLWYRAPEVLLGSAAYDEGVDLWATGCVIAEVLGCEPLLPAEDEADLLWRMCALLGTPNSRIWPDLRNLPAIDSGAAWADLASVRLGSFRYNSLPERLRAASLEDHAVQLLERMLVYAPHHRLRARAALGHALFATWPHPTHPSLLPALPSAQSTEVGREKTEKRKRQRHQLSQGAGSL